MDGSGWGGGKVFGRFSEPAHRVLGLAREEAERFGHRYFGPEHALLGMLAEGQRQAARVLRLAGMDLAAARAALARLAGRGVVPAARPSDAEQTFGVQAVGEAQALGHNEVRPEHLLLGVLEDARQPADTVPVSRRHRQILAHVGPSERYQGAMALLVADLAVDLAALRNAVAVELGGVQR